MKLFKVLILSLTAICSLLPTFVFSQVDSSWSRKNKGKGIIFDDGEFMIDTSIIYVSAPDLQTAPSVAFDGTNYLVVWEDHREGVDIYGARVTQEGIVLDRQGIEISTATGSQSSPSVAFDGTNFLVVWEDTRNGSANDIYGTRVTQDGEVLDRTGIVISRATGVQFAPAVTFGSNDYLVVWTDSRHGSDQTDVYGTRVSRTGQVLDTAGIAVRRGPYIQQAPALAFDGTNWLVAWQHLIVTGFADIHGARVSTAGAVLDSIVVSSADSNQAAPAVAFDGTNYLVAWEDERNGMTTDIFGARVSTAGSVLDPNGIAVSTADLWQREPSVAFDGTNYLVAWDDLRGTASTDIYAARVSPEGALLDPTGFVVASAANTQTIPAIAFDGTNYLAVWRDARSVSSADIYGTRITPFATVLDPFGIAITATVNVQHYPSVAFDGANYLVAWSDDRNGDFDIYGARVSQAGVMLDTAALALSTADGDQSYPVLAYDGTNYLVVWEDERSGGYADIYATRVSPAGVVLNPVGIAVSTASRLQLAPVVAYDGANYLVVWQDFRDATNFKIYGARVTPAGVVLDPAGIPISTQNCYQYAPGMAFGGTNYLVAWMDHRSDPYYDIYGARVSPSGAVLDSAGFIISAAQYSQRYPSIAFDGTNWLVTWDDASTGNINISGARISPSGAVLDSAGFTLWPTFRQQITPKVAFDGTDWLTVWRDQRGADYDICGARVNSAGVVVDSFFVTAQPNDQHAPAIACGIGSNALAAYFGWTDTLFGRVYDAFRVWARPTPFDPVGIEDANPPSAVHNPRQPTTIVRGVLNLQSAIYNPQSEITLFDISGRKIIDLYSGANDIRHLSPGVYFINTKEKGVIGKVSIIK